MYKSKMMIVMRQDLKMRKGKIAAQAGHACIDAILMALSKEGRTDHFEMTADGLALKSTLPTNRKRTKSFESSSSSFLCKHYI